tara:strand:- start:4275 stop:5228 length:954 start_codon:yes stop_codon:yes gene_type:complete
MKILITGCAGFIGFHLTNTLLQGGKHKILGIDNLNNYYPLKIKLTRLRNLKKYKNFSFSKGFIENNNFLKKKIKKFKPELIFHLAAQAGVRYSFKDPKTYYNSNISGFYNILENSRTSSVKHLIFASSSSVYGNNKNYPLKENLDINNPISFYASTKVCNEILAKSYSNNFKLNITGIRFFTVYGPFGRPDMFIYKLFDSLIKGKKINVYNYGQHFRDFTYIDDAIKSLIMISKKKKKGFEVFNICSGRPIFLKKIIKICEKLTKRKTKIKYLTLQKGDIKKTHGSPTKIFKYTKNIRSTSIESGLTSFYNWFKNYK